MTLITFKDGVMAADTQCTNTVTRRTFDVSKLHKMNGSLFGILGTPSLAERMIPFIKTGKQGVLKSSIPPSMARVIQWDGSSLYLYEFIGRPRTMSLFTRDKWEVHWDKPLEINNEFYAVGSGAGHAIGAMHMGATAEEAITIASHYTSNINDRVESVTL